MQSEPNTDNMLIPPLEVSSLPNQHPIPSSPPEISEYAGLESTRYGDWEKQGRCIDF